MAQVFIEETTLSSIGDAIREKGGTNELISPLDMPNAIINLPSGGGGGDIPEEAFNLTGSCYYRFSYNGWNWFVDTFSNQITTKNISNIDHMFYSSNKLTNIPFDINITNTTTDTSQCFALCDKLTNVPYIIGPERKAPTGSYSGCLNLSMFFYGCYSIRHVG